MALEDTYKPSGGPIVPLKGLTASAKGQAGDFVIVLNPGTTGTYKQGADTASAHYAGIATKDFDQAAGDTEVEADIGGAIVECTHSGGSQDAAKRGNPVFIDGPNSVAASGNVYAGRIYEIVSATRVKVKTHSLDFRDLDVS